MDDKVFTYKVEGESFIAVKHTCLACDKPILIGMDDIKVNALFYCTSCGLDSRMSAAMVDGIGRLLVKIVENHRLATLEDAKQDLGGLQK